VIFEGVKMKKSQIKRLPLRRGKGKFKSKGKPIIVNLGLLSLLKGSTVDIDSLVKSGIVDARQAKLFGVKILGDGEIKKKLTINLPISKSAKKKVEKAGGKVVEADTKEKKKKVEK
jgi:large subunit ribosomal protein L15